MMYANAEEYTKDFAIRTLENYEMLKNKPYGVTALVNSMLGLLVIPETKMYNKISDNMVDSELLDALKQPKQLKKYTYPKNINLQQLCRHIRNAVAHSRIDFAVEKPPMHGAPMEIHTITFSDEGEEEGKKCEFALEMTIEQLEKFLYDFSNSICKTL